MESSVGDGSGSGADTSAGGGSSGRRATTRTARRLRKIATIRKRPSRPASPAFQWLALIARPSAGSTSVLPAASRVRGTTTVSVLSPGCARRLSGGRSPRWLDGVAARSDRGATTPTLRRPDTGSVALCVPLDPVLGQRAREQHLLQPHELQREGSGQPGSLVHPLAPLPLPEPSRVTSSALRPRGAAEQEATSSMGRSPCRAPTPIQRRSSPPADPAPIRTADIAMRPPRAGASRSCRAGTVA